MTWDDYMTMSHCHLGVLHHRYQRSFLSYSGSPPQAIREKHEKARKNMKKQALKGCKRKVLRITSCWNGSFGRFHDASILFALFVDAVESGPGHIDSLLKITTTICKAALALSGLACGYNVPQEFECSIMFNCINN